MAHQLILEFSGVSEDDYWAVNDALGMDREMTTGWPDGILGHSAGHTDDGTFVVTEVWSTRNAQAAFMDGRLGAALHAAGVSAPTRMTWVELITNRVL